MAEINFDSIGISDEEMEISETVQTPSKYLINVRTLINKHIYAPHDGETVAMQIWPKKPFFCNFCCARETLPIKFTLSIRTFYLLFAYKNLRIHRNKRMLANSLCRLYIRSSTFVNFLYYSVSHTPYHVFD